MNISDIRGRVKPFVNGCPTPLVDQALSDTMRQFTIDTKIYEATLPTEYTIAGVVDVPLTLPGLSTLAGIVSVQWSLEDYQNYQGKPPYTLTLGDIPLVNGETIDVIAALATGKSETVLPQILEPYEEALSWGAIKRLCELPKKEWTSPDYVSYFGNKYEDGKRAAISLVRDRQGRAYMPLRTAIIGNGRA